MNGPRWLVLIGLLLAARAVPAALSAPLASTPSIIFHNGAILTMETDLPVVEAIAISGEKIEALGSDEEILALQAPGTTVIDLEGRTLMPGFVDSHTHVLNDARANGRSLDQAQYQALSHGITTLGDLYVDESFVREMQAFADRGELRVRTSLYLVANTNCGQDKGNWYKKYPPTRQPGEMLRIGGVKIFTDGGSCGNVALSFELEPGQGTGDLWLTQDELNRMVSEAQAGGYQAAIHAIGDRAVAQAQNAIAFALDGAPNSYRHRIEHASVLRPELISRFGELGIVPVINGQYPACTPFGPPIPEAYQSWEWPWRALRAANPDVHMAWHSDYPFLSINPFVHLTGFVTRTDIYQSYTCPAAGWLRDDTLTVPEALSIMTLESAYALFRDQELGSLRPGKYADVIVISDNPVTVPVDKLSSIHVLTTIVGGRWEYCSPRNPELCPAFQARVPQPLADLRPAVPVRWLMLALAAGLPLIAGAFLWRPRAGMWLVRLGGAAGLAGGGLWLWVWGWAMRFSIGDASEFVTWSLLGAGSLLAIGVVGLSHPERPNGLGGLGLAIAWLGMVLLSVGTILTNWFRLDVGWMLIVLGLLGHPIGLITLGLANWRARRRSPVTLLPLAVGLVGGLLPFGLSSSTGESAWVGYGLGLGWIFMGLAALIFQRAENRPAAFRVMPVPGGESESGKSD